MRWASSGAFALTSAILLAACGGASTSVRTPRVTVQPDPTPRGFALGDTDDNPDYSYECAFARKPDGTTVIAYTIVAGTDDAAGDTICAAVDASGGWDEVDPGGIPGEALEVSAFCHWTTSNGLNTVRIYTATAGTPEQSSVLCAALRSQFAGKPR